MHAVIRIACASMLMLLFACGEQPPPPTHHVTFVARADDMPLSGVAISIDAQELGSTNSAGELAATLSGPNGTTIAYAIRCPVGHRAPTDLAPLVLREFRSIDEAVNARGIEVRVDCPPSERRIAVVVKAPQGGNLPLLVQGRVVARTDANGYAHVFVRSSPDASFSLAFDTTSQPLLRPTNPTREFRVADSDDYFLLEQPFVLQQAPEQPQKQKRHRSRTHTVVLPYKIPSRR